MVMCIKVERSIKISTGRMYFWIISCIFLLQNTGEAKEIRGIPEVDYPTYYIIPETTFRCSDQLYNPGFYADTETRCQVFHYCYDHRQESFLCPMGTIFNQPILSCDYWYSSNCSLAPSYYHFNEKKTDQDHPEIIIDPLVPQSEKLFDKMANLYQANFETTDSKNTGEDSREFKEPPSSLPDASGNIEPSKVIKIVDETKPQVLKYQVGSFNSLNMYESENEQSEQLGIEEDIVLSEDGMLRPNLQDFEKTYPADESLVQHEFVEYEEMPNMEEELGFDSDGNVLFYHEGSESEALESVMLNSDLQKRLKYVDGNSAYNTKRPSRERKPIFIIPDTEPKIVGLPSKFERGKRKPINLGTYSISHPSTVSESMHSATYASNIFETATSVPESDSEFTTVLHAISVDEDGKNTKTSDDHEGLSSNTEIVSAASSLDGDEPFSGTFASGEEYISTKTVSDLEQDDPFLEDLGHSTHFVYGEPGIVKETSDSMDKLEHSSSDPDGDFEDGSATDSDMILSAESIEEPDILLQSNFLPDQFDPMTRHARLVDEETLAVSYTNPPVSFDGSKNSDYYTEGEHTGYISLLKSGVGEETESNKRFPSEIVELSPHMNSFGTEFELDENSVMKNYGYVTYDVLQGSSRNLPFSFDTTPSETEKDDGQKMSYVFPNSQYETGFGYQLDQSEETYSEDADDNTIDNIQEDEESLKIESAESQHLNKMLFMDSTNEEAEGGDTVVYEEVQEDGKVLHTEPSKRKAKRRKLKKSLLLNSQEQNLQYLEQTPNLPHELSESDSSFSAGNDLTTEDIKFLEVISHTPSSMLENQNEVSDQQADLDTETEFKEFGALVEADDHSASLDTSYGNTGIPINAAVSEIEAEITDTEQVVSNKILLEDFDRLVSSSPVSLASDVPTADDFVLDKQFPIKGTLVSTVSKAKSKAIDGKQKQSAQKQEVSEDFFLRPVAKKSSKKSLKGIRLNKSTRKLQQRSMQDFNPAAISSLGIPGEPRLSEIPSMLLKMKYSNLKQYFPRSMPTQDLDNLFFPRTGDIFETSNSSPLISFGKKLLKAKRAKFNMLKKFVESFRNN